MTPHDEPYQPDEGGVPTHAMMIAALNQILAECGYDPVPEEDEEQAPADGPAARLIEDARQRADGIVAAALETAVQYTDAALDRAARTVLSARGTLGVLPAAVDPLERPGPPAGGGAGHSVGDLWFAATVAAGVYLPLTEDSAARTLGAYADCLRDAAAAVPPDLDAAYRVGVEVVALGVSRPGALPATVTLVLDHLGDGDAVPGPARQVAGAFAAGFAAALQARTLAQQESLHRATQRAAREFQSALQHSEARYHRLAYYDPVTGLATKARLVQRLRQAANANGNANGNAGADANADADGNADDPARHVGLCLIDLGGLSAVGEQFGAGAGDHVLAEVARRLQRVARHPDCLLARHSEHAFVLLVQDSGGLAHLAELAERLTRALAAPASLPGTGLTAPLQAAVGVVDVPTAGLDVTRVLLDAEIAVRQARAGTSGWAVYDWTVHDWAVQDWAGHDGVGHDGAGHDWAGHDWTMQDWAGHGPRPAVPGRPHGAAGVPGLITGPPSYQPVVRLSSGRVAGLHARTAWRHPHLGALDLGRIGQLTGDRDTTTRLAGSLLGQACRQAMAWDGGGRGPFIALELPVYQIGYPDIVELVRDALTGSGLPPKRLHLHLSGLDAVPAGEHSHTVLTALAALGVRLELDGFGTGGGSVAYLRELPVHGLRTPASLLRSPGTGVEADRKLLAGMTRVAHALGLPLTVHGVDDEETQARLAGTGVDSAQGLRYGPPSTPHQVAALLRPDAELVAATGRRAAP